MTEKARQISDAAAQHQATDWRRVPGKAAARWRRRTKPGRVVCACLTSWCCHGTDVFHLGMHRMRKIAA